jgi:2'-5' RNA ligase
VIWLGVHDETGGLLSLQKTVSAEVKKSGFEIEDRSFKPHVTLARIKERLPVPSLEKTIQETFLPLPTTVKIADRFLLYKSRLLPGGAVHDVLKTYSFPKAS